MKTNIIILLTIALAAYGLTHYLSQGTALLPSSSIGNQKKTDQSVSNFTFTDIAGKTHEAADFKGKKVILNFWASWCAPCVKEFPALLNAAKNNPDTILIALSSDLSEAAITTFIDKMKTTQSPDFTGENILIAWDKDQAITGDLFKTFKLPETLLIDENQIIRHKFIGADWTAQDLQNQLDKL